MIGRIPSVLCNVTEKQKQRRGRVLSRLDSFLLLLLLLLNKEFAVARQRRDHRGRADSLHLWKGFVELLESFHGTFGKFPWNFWKVSMDFLESFHGIFGKFPWNFWKVSMEFLKSFHGIFGKFPWNF